MKNKKKIDNILQQINSKAHDIYERELKNYVEQTYINWKEYLENIVLIPDDPNDIPIVFAIETKLETNFRSMKDGRIFFKLEIGSLNDNESENMLLLGQWDGTLQTNSDLVNYVKKRSEIEVPDGETKTYYFIPNNANIKFENTITKDIKSGNILYKGESKE